MSEQLWNRRISEITRSLSPAARDLARSLGLCAAATAGLTAFSRGLEGVRRGKQPGKLSVRFEASKVRWGKGGIRFSYASCHLEVDGLRVARLLLGRRKRREKRFFVAFDHSSDSPVLVGEAKKKAATEAPLEGPLVEATADGENKDLALQAGL